MWTVGSYRPIQEKESINFTGMHGNGITQNQAKSEGIDSIKYLENNDSYIFFQNTGGLYKKDL